MKPQYFEHANRLLTKPEIMEGECGNLHVHTDGRQVVSKWKASLWERIKFLFHGTLWIGILSGETQPPIWMAIQKKVFEKED